MRLNSILTNINLLFLLVIFTSCSMGNLNSEDIGQLRTAKKIAVISAFGDSMRVNSAGTVFSEAHYDVSAKTFKINSLSENFIINQVEARLPSAKIDNAPHITTRPLIQEDPAFRKQTNSQKLDQLMAELKKEKYEYLILLSSFNSGSYAMTQPYGIYEKNEELYAYQTVELKIINLATKQPIAYQRLDTSWDRSIKTFHLHSGGSIKKREYLKAPLIRMAAAKIIASIRIGISDAFETIWQK